MKAEEHLWAGVVGGFHAKCTELGKFVFKCRIISHINTDFLNIYFAHFIGYSSGFHKLTLQVKCAEYILNNLVLICEVIFYI